MKEPNNTLQAFQTLFPTVQQDQFFLRPKNLSDFPFWLRSAADAYTLEISAKEKLHVTLIRPKGELSFDQLINIYRQVSAKTGQKTLLIADSLNPKHRPLLVKFGIPFIFKNESIFAPNLALVFDRLKSLEQKKEQKDILLKEELSPFALKLIAGHIIGELSQELTLKSILQKLPKAIKPPSRAKLSNVMNELVRAGLATSTGAGPKKTFSFLVRRKLWSALGTTRFSAVMKIIEGHYELPKRPEYVLSSESALATYSDLASPKIVTIAVSSAVYSRLSPSQSTIYIQVWKSDPRLFSVKGNLNPIELYFSMRSHPDERVQLALKQMLSKYDLTPFRETSL